MASRGVGLFCFNHLTNFNQTSQECSFGGPISKLFKDLNSIENFGCCGNRKGENCQILKNLLVQKYWPDLKIILYNGSLGYPLPRLFKYFRSVGKTWPPGGGAYFPYMCIVKTLKIFLSKSTSPIWRCFAQMFIGAPFTKIVQIFPICWKTWPPGCGACFPYMCVHC